MLAIKKLLPTSRKSIIVAALIVLLLVGTTVYATRRQAADRAEGAQATTADGRTMDLSPPTKEEKQAVEDNKDRLVDRQDLEDRKPGAEPANVTPIITTSGYYGSEVEARGFVPGIYEEGGTCTLTLTKGSQEIKRSAASTKGATTTDCPVFRIARSDIPESGSWTATLSYTSTGATGTSEPSRVEVP